MYLVKMGIQELLTKVYFSLSIATVAKVQLSAVSYHGLSRDLYQHAQIQRCVYLKMMLRIRRRSRRRREQCDLVIIC